jgi:acetolactate synthase-1/2/3 large subunit
MGMIKHGQRLGGAEQIGFELPPVDFAQMAQAMGARGHTVRTMPELEALDFDEICRRPGPTLLDVYIDPEEVPPIGARLKTLGR